MTHPSAETRTDVMDPARAAAFQVALGQGALIEAGSALPPFFHQLYFWSPHPPSKLGATGTRPWGAG